MIFIKSNGQTLLSTRRLLYKRSRVQECSKFGVKLVLRDDKNLPQKFFQSVLMVIAIRLLFIKNVFFKPFFFFK